MLNRFPHEFSGGQRQRIVVARSLMLNPELLICDEPVSALDVSVQAQIINILKDLQEEMGLTYLFVAHDLSVVNYISDRIAVMYLGKIVEISTSDSIYSNPKHPYTEALLGSIPVPDPEKKRKKVQLEGTVPNPANPPSGCSFHPRCKYAIERCKEETPELEEVNGHKVACFRAKELKLKGFA
jgi:oligopeptide/dipeptide ABC transporter ATP-binding protein